MIKNTSGFAAGKAAVWMGRWIGLRAVVVPVLLAMFGAGCSVRVPQPNLGLYKKELTQWHESGDYDRAVAQAQRRAPEIVRREAKKRPRPALVLDIDETSLSNWNYLRAYQFGITPRTFREWVKKHDDPAIAPTLTLYRTAREAGVDVFFISGRREGLRADTERQLRAAGYEEWKRLILRPENDTNPSAIPFKTAARREIEREGYTIILNMGDQESDLAGGFARHRIKLPNPYYFIP